MTASVDMRLHGLAIYNPDLLSKEELIGTFAARQRLLERLLERLRRQLDADGAPQHQLLIGRRGMGKTTLLRRLRYAIEDDPSLEAAYLPLVFPEEQYGIAHLAHFWLNCLDALGDALEESGRTGLAAKLDGDVEAVPRDPATRREHALDLLLKWARTLDRRLVLLVDNLDVVLDRLDDSDEWALRETLSDEPSLQLVAAASRPLEATFEYERAFYDFFRVHSIEGLDDDETVTVLRHLAERDGNTAVEQILEREPARIKTIRVLTGGNPRTIVLLYTLLARDGSGDVRTDLERLLDASTPLYKARFEALPPVAQRVVHALAIGWDPMTARAVADATELPINNASSQLARLLNLGVVEKVPYPKRTGFQVAERFFNIWYLMRASRRVRRRLVWLVKFLELFFTPEQLRRRALDHLARGCEARSSRRLRHAEYSLALADAVSDSPTRGALATSGLGALMADASLRSRLGELIDLDGEDAELKTKAERLRVLAEAKETILEASIEWGDGSAEAFWALLGGASSLSPFEKLELAKAVAADPTRRGPLAQDLRNQREELQARVRSRPLCEALAQALIEGYMEQRSDLQGAREAAVALPCAGLPALAMAARIERGADRPDPETFRETLGDLEGLSYPWTRLGDLLQHLGRYDEAEAAFREAISRDEASAPPRINLGNLLADDLGRHEEAEAAYREAIARDEADALAWNNLGVLLADDLGRYEEAEAAYREAIVRDEADALAWNNLGDLLADHLGRHEEAEAAYREAIARDEAEADSWTNLGNLLADHLGRYEEAEAAYREAIARDETDALPWSNLGILLADDLGRHAEAEGAYREAIARDEDYALPWNSLGNLLADHVGRYEEAEAAYREAIARDEAYAHPWNGLGIVLRHLGRHEEAEAAYREAIARDETDAFPWNNLGNLLAEDLGRHEEAEAAYRKATARDEAFALPWNGLGNLLGHRLGRYEEAQAAYREAIARDEASALPWTNLGDLLADHLSRYEEAEAAYREAIARDEAYARAWSNLGDLLADHLGRYEEAEAVYREAIARDEAFASPWNGLAWLLFTRQDRTDEAEALARRAVELEPASSEYAHTLACILARAGRWDEAASRMRAVLAEASDGWLERCWPDIVTFFIEAVASGHAVDARALLVDTGFDERWRPLAEALTGAAEGSRGHLQRLSPELRLPTAGLLEQLAPDVT